MEIQTKPLCMSGFRKYGRYESLCTCDLPFIGQSPVRFYRDLFPIGDIRQLAISMTTISPMPLTVGELEYHSNSPEVFISLDNDSVMCLGIATPDAFPDVDKLEAFYLPAKTIVYLHPGVWHYAPFPLNDKPLNTLVLLPERTYANDCVKVDISSIHSFITVAT